MEIETTKELAFKSEVKSCARCGANHEEIVFLPFLNPVEDTDGTKWEWWGMCPNRHEPILLRKLEVKSK